MKMIGAETKLCCLIGHPVAHSLSPAMHNSAFTYLGLDYTYLAFDIKPENLEQAIRAITALNIAGANVTIPYKETVAALLDYLDPLAYEANAVNTIVNRDGVLWGHNTDIPGFLNTLHKHHIELDGTRVALLGAGGASRAIAFALAKEGARLTILNRHPERALEIASHLRQKAVYPVEARGLGYGELKDTLERVDLLVNATSVGMKPAQDESPIPPELIPPGITIVDLVYNPARTRLLVEGEKRGATTVSGLEVLLYQGALSFELWTGTKAPIEIMWSEIDQYLSPALNVKQSKSSLALIGFMGAGKTSIARMLADKLDKELVDIDQIIEFEAKKPIERIFAEDGEIIFRELEIATVSQISARENLVIACGGGIILNQINIDRLRERALIVYLEAAPETIYKRIEAYPSARPLFHKDPKKILKLMALRKPLYQNAADVTVDTTNLTPEEVARIILNWFKANEG